MKYLAGQKFHEEKKKKGMIQKKKIKTCYFSTTETFLLMKV